MRVSAAPSALGKGRRLGSPELGPPFIEYGNGRKAEYRYAHVERLSTRARKYNWELTPHRHSDLFQLLLAVDGGGEIAFDLQLAPFGAPALVLVPPLIVHRFAFRPGSRAFLLTIAETYLAELTALMHRGNLHDLLGHTQVLPLAPGSTELQQIELAYRALAARVAGDLARPSPLVPASLLFVLSALMEQAQAQAQAQGIARPLAAGSRSRLLYERFRKLVEKNYAKRWPISAYVEALGTTERTLGRVSWVVAGAPPLKIVHRRIAIEAQRRLLYGAGSVSEIGYSLGFEDPAHFSRFFNDNVGESPIAFRRRRIG